MSSLLTTQTKAITQSALLMISAYIESGETRLLKEIGMTDFLVKQMMSMTTTDLMMLVDRSRSNFVEIKINTENLTQVLKDLNNSVLVNKLLLAGAPNDLVVSTLGVTTKQCGIRRKELGIDGYASQRVAQSDEEYNIIIDLWLKFKKAHNLVNEDLSAEQWLELHSVIGSEYKEVSLKVIHNCISVYNTNEEEFQLKLQSQNATQH